jgi:hypothetical protein
MQKLNLEQIGQYINYDPDTGDFIQTKSTGRRAAGEKINYISNTGYKTVNFKGKRVLGHRLAWYMHYGEWPIGSIDHVNRDRLDNRICNLRLANLSQNGANTCKRKNNSTGYKGVSFYRNRYHARATINRKTHLLGSFITAEEASKAYEQFAKEKHREFYYGGVNE